MSTQAYSDLMAIVSQSHSPQKVKDAYGKVIRHLYLARPDLVDDMVLIAMEHEKMNRLNFGLKAKADGLAKDKEELKRRLYNRRNR